MTSAFSMAAVWPPNMNNKSEKPVKNFCFRVGLSCEMPSFGPREMALNVRSESCSDGKHAAMSADDMVALSDIYRSQAARSVV